MKEITLKIHNKHMESFKTVIEQMAAEGATEVQILKAYNAYIKCKVGQYYEKHNGGMQRLGDFANFMEIGKADSKAEKIFYEMLVDAGINFKFQYAIGPYTADYLIAGFIVFEIDGTQHLINGKHDDVRDKYMQRMGYKVVRVPLDILCACPEAVIEEIQDIVKIKRVK
jgi:very-short-patch-repair endonuclease